MPVCALCTFQYVLQFNVFENRRRFPLRKRLQSYYIFLNYTSFFTLLSQFEPFYSDTNKL